MKINKFLVSEDLIGLKCPKIMEPRYITIHNTNDINSAEFTIKWMRQAFCPVSFHYAVGADIWQGIEDTRAGYHCGDGIEGVGNSTSIGIEICYSSDYESDKFKNAYLLATKLVAHLMKKHSIPIENVVPHKHWSNENCPRRILDAGLWEEFIDLCKEEFIKEMEAEDEPRKI